MKLITEKQKMYLRWLINVIKIPLFILLLGCILMGFAWVGVGLAQDTSLRQAHHIAGQVGSILIILSFVLFFYRLLSSGCEKYRHFLVQKKYYTMSKVILAIRKGFRILFALIAMNVIVSVFDFDRHYFAVINNVIYVVMIAAVAWVLLEVISIIEDILYRRYLDSRSLGSGRSSLTYTKFHIIKNILAIIIVMIAIAASLMVFDKVRTIGISLLASAGFLTAIFALAAQKTLSSVFGGFQLALSQSVEIGDYVTIENVSGTVEEITLSYVRVALSDGRSLILPVSYFIEKPFQNWSRASDGVLGSVRIYVSYKAVSVLNKIRAELNKILQSNPLWNQKKATINMTELLEGNIELKVTVSADNPEQLDNLRNDVREKLLALICEQYPEMLPNYHFPR